MNDEERAKDLMMLAGMQEMVCMAIQSAEEGEEDVAVLSASVIMAHISNRLGFTFEEVTAQLEKNRVASEQPDTRATATAKAAVMKAKFMSLRGDES